MATSVVPQPTLATGDTIEALTPNTARDNINLLDGRTGGDPGALGKILGSSGSLGGQWLSQLFAHFVDNQALADDVVDARVIANTTITATEIATDAITTAKILNLAVTAAKLAPGAAVSNTGYTPVNQAGDTMTGKLTLSGNSGAGNNLDALDLSNAAGSNAGTYMRFITAQGAMTFGFFYGNAVCNLLDHNGTEALSIHWGDALLYRYGNKVWDAATDGSGSGLDADLLDGFGTSQTGAANVVVVADSGGHVALAFLSGITDTQVASANKDGVVGTASLRTLGTGAQQAAAGTHGHTNLASGLTINGNTAWHAGNDGSGSGLDADLFDGADSTAYARLGQPSDFTTAPTINSAAVARLKTGSYNGNSTMNSITGVGFAASLLVITDTTSGLQHNIVAGTVNVGINGGGSIGSGSISVNSGGFSFTDAGGGANTTGHHYTFLAIG